MYNVSREIFDNKGNLIMSIDFDLGDSETKLEVVEKLDWERILKGYNLPKEYILGDVKVKKL